MPRCPGSRVVWGWTSLGVLVISGLACIFVQQSSIISVGEGQDALEVLHRNSFFQLHPVSSTIVAANQPQALPSTTTKQRAAEGDQEDPLSLWTKFPDGMDDYTREVQAFIHASQNPPDCRKAKYFAVWTNDYGMGSDLHTVGAALGLAANHSRVLIYHYSNEWVYTSKQDCHHRTNPDCFFIPLSKCQHKVSHEKIDEAPVFRFQDSQLIDHPILELQLDLPDVLRDVQHVAPWVHGHAHEFDDIQKWRAQATKYMVRPNTRMVEWAKKALAKDLVRYPPLEGWNATTSPPPELAICMHVRHGDKWKEMELHDFSEYVESARKLVRDEGAPPVVFLTVDDEAVIQDIESGAVGQDLTFYYVRYNRRNDLKAQQSANLLGRSYFGRLSVTNLMLGVHPSCRWFVETTGSNWNRLINELRLTDGIRANDPWIDLETSGQWRKRRRSLEEDGKMSPPLDTDDSNST